MKPLSTIDLIFVSLYGFGISFYWSCLTSILLPQKILQLVSPSLQGSALGLVTAIGSLILICLEPVAGVVSDRSQSRLGKRRPFMAFGTAGMGVLLILTLMSPSYWIFLASFLLLKVFWAVAEGTYPALMPDLVPESQRGKAAGYLGLLAMTGAIAGASVAGKILAYSSWLKRTLPMDPVVLAGLVTFLVVAICMVVVWIAVKEPIPAALSQPTRSIFGEAFNLRPFLKEKEFLLLSVSRMFWYFGFNSVLAFLLFFVKDGLHQPDYANVTSNLMSVLWATTLPTVLTAGMLSDRLGRRKPLIYFSALLMILSVIGFIYFVSVPQIMVAMGLWGLGGGIFFSVTWAMGTESFPEAGSNARYLAIWISLSQGIPWLVGPPVAGILLDHWGYSALFVWVLLCFVLGLALFYPVRETGWREKGCARAAGQVNEGAI